MATFTITGFELLSESGQGISEMKGAELQLVSSLGMATLDFDYVSDDPDSAEVSLSDYNILLNGLHLNDGDLPERIELFELNWMSDDGPRSSQIMNFAYEGEAGTQDLMFSVGRDPLPELSDAGAVDALLSTANFLRARDHGDQQSFQIQLDQMPDVSVSGVVLNLFEDAMTQEPADTFHFFQPSDADSFDAQAFDLALLAEDADANDADAPTMPDHGATETVPDFIPDPGIDDFAG